MVKRAEQGRVLVASIVKMDSSLKLLIVVINWFLSIESISAFLIHLLVHLRILNQLVVNSYMIMEQVLTTILKYQRNIILSIILNVLKLF